MVEDFVNGSEVIKASMMKYLVKGWVESCTFLNWSAAHSNASNVGLGSLFSIGVVDHKLDGVDGLIRIGKSSFLFIVTF